MISKHPFEASQADPEKCAHCKGYRGEPWHYLDTWDFCRNGKGQELFRERSPSRMDLKKQIDNAYPNRQDAEETK